MTDISVTLHKLAFCALLGVAACVAAPAPTPAAPGFEMIRGALAPGRQPDGNSIVLDSNAGLIVFDTGRHREHTDKIIVLAKSRAQPVVAIINSHWHLDHISGNIPLRELYPAAKVYNNDAALTDALGDFLKKSAQQGRMAIQAGGLPAGRADELNADLATIDAGAKLHPDVSIEKPQTLTIGGRRLDLHTAKGASAGDIWIYDPRAKLLLSGDLVTLPAPFLDTACPKNWSLAFDDMLKQPFTTLIPGHGRQMVRGDLERYRDAFNGLISCAATPATPDACAASWADGVAPLLDDQATPGAAKAYARYYVESILRKPESRPAWCAA